jgi:type IVB pilus formation R64 PilN family outer membrane protein
MKNLIKTALVASIVLALAGCNTAATRYAKESFDNGAKLTKVYNDQVTPTWDTTSVTIDRSGFYAAKTPIDATSVELNENNYPDAFNKLSLLHLSPNFNIYEVSQYISKATGYRIALDQDAFTQASGNGVAGNNSSANPSSLADSALGDISFANGSLASMLDAVTARFGLHWRWTGNAVVVYRYETRMFRVDALTGSTTSTANLNTTSSSLASGGGGSSGGGQAQSNNTGTSGDNTSVSSTDDSWKEIEGAIKSVASTNAKIQASPGAGLIVVRDAPENLAVVSQIISEYNHVYTKQVLLRVQVYSVDRNDADNYGVDWDAVWQTASSKFGFSYSTGSTNTGSSPNSSGNIFTLTSKGGPWNSSKAIFSALSTLGKTTLLTNNSIITLNGKTAPLNVATEQAYVQSYATTLAGTSGSPTTTITPGVVQGGFTMDFTPRILGDNDVLMRYSVNLSTINQIVNYTSPDGSAGVQLPTITVRNFLQDTKVHSGDTVVLTGFQQTNAQDTSSGIGSANNWGLGGKKNNTVDNSTIVIVVTPYIEE